MKPIAGTVTSPPMTAPSPRVDASRNLLRGNRSPGAGSGIAASPRCAGIAGAVDVGGTSRRSGSIGSGTRPYSIVASRAQRKPKMTAIAAPIGAISVGLTISPTRMHATPAANAIGYSDGPGRCGRSSC